jgi:hypothetical protein
MDQVTLQNVHDIQADKRLWLEGLLGQQIGDNQQVLIMVVTPGTVADEETHRAVVERAAIERIERTPADELDAAVERQLRSIATRSPIERERGREQIRLRLKFPSEYVAYLDLWQTLGGEPRLERDVIAHSATFSAVDQAVTQWRTQNPQLDEKQVRIEFVDDGVPIPSPVLE